jgi:integrase
MPRRRGRNEGSIFKRRDGRWEAQLDLGWQGGKRRRKYFYAATRSEVQAQLTSAIHHLQRGLPPTQRWRQTVGEHLTHWLETTLKARARPRSYEGFEVIVRRHIAPTLGKVTLQKLGPQDIQSLLDKKLQDGLAPQTVKHIRTVLRSALNQALRFNLVARNVATLVDPPSISRPKIRALSPDEARLLLKTVNGERLEALYTATLALGLRRGEILGP